MRCNRFDVRCIDFHLFESPHIFHQYIFPLTSTSYSSAPSVTFRVDKGLVFTFLQANRM